MNISEHTNGDWQATRGSHSYPLEITTETKTIAQIETRKTITETEANAYLIAAAPDLLAACEDALTMLKEVLSQHMEHEADGSRIKIPLEKKLEAAIKKAK